MIDILFNNAYVALQLKSCLWTVKVSLLFRAAYSFIVVVIYIQCNSCFNSKSINNLTLMISECTVPFPLILSIYFIYSSLFSNCLHIIVPLDSALTLLSLPGPAINHWFPTASHAFPTICQHLMCHTTSCNSLCTSTCFEQLSFLSH